MIASSLIFVSMFALLGSASALTPVDGDAGTIYVTSINSEFTPRIINGGFAPVGRYPYAVSIRRQGRQHFCGGSLIAPNLILSAAHCSITYGEVFINRYNLSDNSPPDQERFDVLEEFVHPQYNYIDYPYDYMIIRINGTSSITPIKLNRDPQIPSDNTTLTVIGWGRNDTEGDYKPSEVLKEAELLSISQSSCDAYWQRYGYDITDDMMCATAKTGINCRGDSGSPLLLLKEDGSSDGDLQVGLVSWGPADCDLPLAPAVYSQISDQIDWIDSIRCLHSSEAPIDVNCSHVNFSVPERHSVGSDITGPGQIRVTIVLYFDEHFYETGFILEDDQGEEVYRVNPGVTGRGTDSLETTVALNVDTSYAIVLLDSADNGFCCLNGTGSYQVYVTDSHNILLSGFGEFEKFKRDVFNTSVDFLYPEIMTGEIRIFILIETQTNSTQLAWTLSRIDVVDQPVMASVEEGKYVGNHIVEQEIVVGVRGGLYAFSFDDPDNQHHFVISVGDTVAQETTVVASGVGKLLLSPKTLTLNFFSLFRVSRLLNHKEPHPLLFKPSYLKNP